jgi:hypothetical protein
LKKSRTEKAAQAFADLTFVMTSLQAAGRNINGQGFKALDVFFQSSSLWQKTNQPIFYISKQSWIMGEGCVECQSAVVKTLAERLNLLFYLHTHHMDTIEP